MSRPVTPLLAVDAIIALVDRNPAPIILVERAAPPHGWALPGGFVDVGETLEAACRREAREETGLCVSLRALLGCYSDPRRDARGHTVSVVFVASATGRPVAADDAAAIRLADPGDPPPLAFDHELILRDYRRYLATGECAPLRG